MNDCMFVQTAFKRSAPTSTPDSGPVPGTAPGEGIGNPSDNPTPDVIDWDSVKADDKILVFQVWQ